jgi:polyvinyl alcohol dehydrogenase (cytochrome)
MGIKVSSAPVTTAIIATAMATSNLPAAAASDTGRAASGMTTVIVPCAGGRPMAVSTKNGKLRVLWHGPGTADGSPVIGGGAVWVTDTGAGVLYELNSSTGRVMHQIRLGAPLAHFESPALTGRVALVGTLRGVVAVTGA